jgi:mannose-6-phosphate isomerase-like protein (cupin superfamily)
MPVLPAPPSPTHVLEGAQFTSLATPNRGSTDTSVWRVELAPGHPATPHQLTREEVFVVLAGRARVRLGDDVREANAGDAIVVPRDTNFELSVEGTEPLQALCCMPVSGEARLADGTTFVPPWAR